MPEEAKEKGGVLMNKTELMGRLTRDPETRGEGTGLVARYTLAVDRRYQKKDGEKETDFINIVVFGKGAEFAQKYFKKGTKVVVVGRIQTGSYTNKDGQKVYTFDVVAEEQEFAESKNSGSGNTSEGTPVAPAETEEEFMSIPSDVQDDMPF